MSGSEGRCERECSGGEGLLGGDGEVDRPVGGRGAADRDPGGRSADLPSEPPAGPSPIGRNFGTPPWKRPPIPFGAPPPKPPPPPPPPPDFSITGALRSLTWPTFFSLAPLWMSDSSAPLPFASDELSLGGAVFASWKVGGGGGPGGGGGGGIGILTLRWHRSVWGKGR